MHVSLLVLLAVLPSALPSSRPGVESGRGVAVVCPAAFRQAIRPWMTYRAEQGYRLVLVDSGGSAADVRRRLARVAIERGDLGYVVLVGDCPSLPIPEAPVPDDAASPAPAARRVLAAPKPMAAQVPVHYAQSTVGVLWGSEPHLSTDHPYGDLDGDGVPELAVGRLPVDTPAELHALTARVIDYERSADTGPWRRRVSVVAGVGGFGLLTDHVIESAARYFLTRSIPPEYDVAMTYASWRSPYCPNPIRFREATLRQFNRGAWFWVYLGHGFPWGLDRVEVHQMQCPILTAAPHDMAALRCEHPGPIALMMACYTGAVDAPSDCLAERMLLQPGGPVAVVAGSRVTMPYGLSLLGHSLMRVCFDQRPDTLGNALLWAKRRMLAPPDDADEDRAMIDTIARAISPSRERLDAERREHVQLINLLGDPLLRLRHPEPIGLDVASYAIPGETLTIHGRSSVAGEGFIELAVARDRMTTSPPARASLPATADGLAAFDAVHARANNRRLAVVPIELSRPGEFRAELTVPREAAGRCVIRAFLGDHASRHAAAARPIKIETSSVAQQAGRTNANQSKR